MSSLPALHSVTTLGPSGPFAHDATPTWFYHQPSHVRVLDISAYQRELATNGQVSPVVAERMRDAGSREVLLLQSHGGKKGHAFCFWDLRVAVVAGPALEVIPQILEIGQRRPVFDDAPLTATRGQDVSVLSGGTGRISAQTSTVGRNSVGLPLRIKQHAGHHVHFVMAVGHIGLSCGLMAPTADEADRAAARMIDALLRDLRPWPGDGERTSPSSRRAWGPCRRSSTTGDSLTWSTFEALRFVVVLLVQAAASIRAIRSLVQTTASSTD